MRQGWKWRQHRGLGLTRDSALQIVLCRVDGEKKGVFRCSSPGVLRGSGVCMASVSCPQDVDEVFQSKMDLEGNLESLREHICFLTRLYEEVRTLEEQGEIRKGGTMDRLPVARRGQRKGELY